MFCYQSLRFSVTNWKLKKTQRNSASTTFSKTQPIGLEAENHYKVTLSIQNIQVKPNRNESKLLHLGYLDLNCKFLEGLSSVYLESPRGLMWCPQNTRLEALAICNHWKSNYGLRWLKDEGQSLCGLIYYWKWQSLKGKVVPKANLNSLASFLL